MLLGRRPLIVVGSALECEAAISRDWVRVRADTKAWKTCEPPIMVSHEHDIPTPSDLPVSSLEEAVDAERGEADGDNGEQYPPERFTGEGTQGAVEAT